MSSRRCRHEAGWYIREVSLMASSDGSALTILASVPQRGARDDKAVAVCNCSCGATRNVYLTGVEFTFGKVRPFRGSAR